LTNTKEFTSELITTIPKVLVRENPDPQDRSGDAGVCRDGDAGRVEFHPMADLFPLLEGEEFDALVADVAKNGLREPIVRHQDGRIVDGRNRYRACLAAGVQPKFRKWDESGSLIEFIISLNLKRRHLSAGQRAALAVDLLPVLEEEARERMAAGGGDKKSGRQKVAHPIADPGKSTDKAAKLTNVNRLYISQAKKLKDEQPELYTDVRAGKKSLMEAKREIRSRQKQTVVEQIKTEPQPVPKGPFRVIVIDPPWEYDPGRTSYPSMTLDAIKRLPIPSLAHPDCLIWLWVPNGLIREAFECLDVWGFEPKAVLTWAKQSPGVGTWLRNQTEHCLMATKGHPVVTLTDQSTLLIAPRREHSRKPDEFFALVESLCPGSKLEMFSRQEREGWCVWGAEVNYFAENPETGT